MHISIHPREQESSDEAECDKLVQRTIPHKLAQCLKSAGEFEALISLNQHLIYSSIRAGCQQARYLRASYQLILEVIRSNFQLATSNEREVLITLAGHTSKIPSVAHNRWLASIGYYHAFTTRAARFRAHLDELDYTQHLVTNTEYDLFNYHHITLMRHVASDPSYALKHFAAGYKRLLELPAEYARGLIVFYPLWEPLLRGDSARFNELLESSIQSHKERWRSHPGDPTQGNALAGHSNFYLTGLMSQAHDLGFSLDVSSDYTPADLVCGQVQLDINTPLEFVYPARELSPAQLLSELMSALNPER